MTARAFGESAAFIGLIVPGATALLVDGVRTATGRLRLQVMLVLAATAAVAGASVGYEMAGSAPRVAARPRWAVRRQVRWQRAPDLTRRVVGGARRPVDQVMRALVSRWPA